MTLALLIVIALQLLVIAATAVFLTFHFYSSVVAHRHGAIFVPSSRERVETMLELVALRPGELALDLGSGDGRILIRAAQAGAHAIGLEINPFLVWYSRRRIKNRGLELTAEVLHQDLRSYPFGRADVVFLYLWPATVAGLKEKLIRELKPGARVISNAFPIPEWIPTKEKHKVFLYTFPDSTNEKTIRNS